MTASLLSAACAYHQRGWWVVPVMGKSPARGGKGWQHTRIDPRSSPDLFDGATGLGLVLGPSGLVDLEADCAAAEQVFASLAPPTDLIWEHGQRCHRAYSGQIKAARWMVPAQAGDANDGLKAALAEVRAGAAQSVIPPSVHPDGLPYTWIRDGEPGATTQEVLHHIARLGALAGAVAPHWHAGQRQHATLALAGCLRERGVAEEETRAVIAAICSEAADDEVAQRLRAVGDTYQKSPDERLTGLPTLAATLGEKLAAWIAKTFPSLTKPGRRSPRADLIQSLHDELQLFPTPGADSTLYAVVPVGGHKEVLPLRSRQFKRWLAGRCYQRNGTVLSQQSLQETLTVLEAQAEFDGEPQPVFTRIAEYDGRIFLDLADDHWRVVEVTATSWRVVSDPPVRFRRTRGMLTLPEPQRGGHVDEFRPFLNVASDDDWTLVLAWMLAALRPVGPYPLLTVLGEQGSAKTSTAAFVRALIDPNRAPLRSTPRDERDLIITASNAWIVGLDNLSHIPAWLSDALCRLSTGGGFATRELHTDSDEWIFSGQRPMILTGIDDLITRGDLLDRSLMLYLPPILAGRKTEADLQREFTHTAPRILGALLSALSGALREHALAPASNLPRMADFARWAVSAEPHLGFEPGTFRRAYVANREGSRELVLDGHPVVPPLRELVATLSLGADWEGTCTELLQVLTAATTEQVRRHRGWPGNARALSSILRRLGPDLRAVGVEVAYLGHTGQSRQRMVRLVRTR